jgi:DNA-binding NarL/FixJ family response regulator
MGVRVLLVEDNEVYRSTLELLLDGREGLEIVGSVADGREAAAAAERLEPHVVLMDFRLPGLDGAGATAAVLAAAPAAAVLCLTAEATDADRQAVLDAGAVGLIEKGRSIDDLVRAIHVGARRSLDLPTTTDQPETERGEPTP